VSTRTLLLPLAALAVLAAALLAYLPGIDGPFVFDDNQNILRNSAVQMERLSAAALAEAALTPDTRMPKRGMARASFALNYHLAGNTFSARAFKLTNIAIHLVNGVLVFALALLLVRRRWPQAAGGPAAAGWIALLTAAVWLLHPLQLTAVLYVVQRMTSLSALFVFAGLCAYVAGRARLERGARGAFWLMGGGIVLGTALGLLNKENAALLPFLAWITGHVFFPTEALPERSRRALARFHLLFVGAPALLAVAGAVWIWESNLDIYRNVRDFTLGERLLTQPRVLLLYLGLFAFPHLRNLSLHHDDFLTSTGLLAPPSTLLALLALAAVAVLGVHGLWRRRLYGFVIAFFLAGHAVESSFLSLEMVYEHRNYVPSFALALALACAAGWFAARTAGPARIGSVLGVALLAALATVTFSRANMWSDEARLARYLVEQNPSSYRSLSLLARVMAVENATVDELMDVYARVARANPRTVFPLVRMARIVTAMQYQVDSGLIEPAAPAPAGVLAGPRWDPPTLYLDPRHLAAVRAALDREIRARLEGAPIHAETVAELEEVRKCVVSNSDMCVGLMALADDWTRLAAASPLADAWSRASLAAIRGQYAARRRDFEAALAFAREAARLGPRNPYFRLHEVVYLGHLGRFDDAYALLDAVRDAHGASTELAAGIAQVSERLDALRDSGAAREGAASG